MQRTCPTCGTAITGRADKVFCSVAHKKRAARRRAAGLAADAHPHGRRGPIPLGRQTRLEVLLAGARAEGRIENLTTAIAELRATRDYDRRQ
jgi:hypothetical protein